MCTTHQELLNKGNKKSGVYLIAAGLGQSYIKVWCDMVTQGGGWTLLIKAAQAQRKLYGYGVQFSSLVLAQHHVHACVPCWGPVILHAYYQLAH